MEPHYKGQRVAGNVCPGIPDTWDAQVVRDLGHELEEDLTPIVEFLEDGGRMRPYEVVGATATTRWEYVDWLRNCFVKPYPEERPVCANKLENAIGRMAAMFVQDQLAPNFHVPLALQSAFEEDEVIVNPRIVHTWDADCIRSMGEELDMDLHKLEEAVVSGCKMRPYELFQATATTRWEYCRFLRSMQGPESEGDIFPEMARSLEKAIARCAVLHAEDTEGSSFEPPEALDSAFDDDDEEEEACDCKAETWNRAIVEQIASESGLELGPLLEYLDSGLRMKPIDVEDASESKRWAYVRWLVEQVGLTPKTASELELAVVRNVAEAMEKQYPGFEIPPCLQSAFDGEAPNPAPSPASVADWTAESCPDLSAVFADPAEMAPLTEYLQGGNAMKPYDLDALTVMARWEYCTWLARSLGFTHKQAQQLEAYIKEQAVAAKSKELGEDYDAPSATYAYMAGDSA